MHNIFAGIAGFFMSFGAMFHGGNSLPPHNTVNANAQTNFSGNTSTSSGRMRGQFGGRKMNLPQGEKPFFGTVTNVSGSTITLQRQMMMHPGMRWHNGSVTPSITPSTPQTVSITVDSSTTYQGGSLSDITTNTKIAGIGKTNSDGSITALQVQINPTFPTGFPHRMGNNNQ